MTGIVKVDPKDFGLEESKAADIAAQFKPMLDKMIELEKEYNEVIKLPIESPNSAKAAKELRLKYVKVRTGTAEIHKQQKAFYLAGGRFVDGWKNAQLFASQGIEEKLEEIEKYAERLEAERVRLLQEKRESLLSPYEVENITQLQLGLMSEDVWSNFLAGTKLNYENKKEAERLAEQKRIEDQRLEAERLEAQRLENERLKLEAQKREAAIEAERKKVEAEREAERKALEQKAAEEKRKTEEEAERQRVILDQQRKDAEAKAELERKERERLEAELREKKEAEQRAEAEKQAAIEAELSKGDKEKFETLLSDLTQLKSRYQFKSKKHKLLQVSVNELIDKIVNFAQPKI